MKFNRLIPELSVSNIEISKRFYLQLGFQIVYEREKDKFAFLELEGNQLMIEEVNNHWSTGVLEYPFGRGINISMTIDDVEAFYKDLQKKKIPFFKELMTNDYEANGTIYHDSEFLIQDPDGYLLRFNN